MFCNDNFLSKLDKKEVGYGVNGYHLLYNWCQTNHYYNNECVKVEFNDM